jgi:7-cyano-7-deazaguanine synthase
MNSHHPAIVLVSGGMDSCVTAAIAAQEHDELAFLHANYGQRTEIRELRAFREIAKHYNVTRTHVVSMTHLAAIGGSSLTDPSIPVSRADLTAAEIPTSYVPFRNANILGVAVSWAEVIGARAIYIGAVEEDSSGYPDCRRSFFDAYNLMITQGTKPGSGIAVRTPLLNLSKAAIVQRGIELAAPLGHTWSCYQEQEEACGICDSCALRLRGFQQAGIADPIPYKVRPDYRH